MSCPELLHGLVARSLAVFDVDTARFFAERLCCEERTEAHLNLLSQCYFRQAKYKQTYHILKESTHPSNRYLFALACFNINRFAEAERALSPNIDALPTQLSDAEIGIVPEGSAGLLLLGRVCRRMQRREAAMFYLKKAIEADASNWSAIQEYCAMGGILDITELCGVDIKTAAAILGGSAADTRLGGGTKKGSVIQTSIAEKIHDTSIGSNQHGNNSSISLSLGKSSMSQHVPFTTAGSPLPIKTETRVPKEDDSMIDNQSVIMISPGLTPIGNQRTSLLVPGGGMFPMTVDRSSVPFTPKDETGRNAHNQQDLFSQSQIFQGDDIRGRRVSFGAPSRLSFSSCAIEETVDDFDENPPSKYSRNSLSTHVEGNDDEDVDMSDMTVIKETKSSRKPISHGRERAAPENGITGGVLAGIGSPPRSASKSPPQARSPPRAAPSRSSIAKDATPPRPGRGVKASATSPAGPQMDSLVSATSRDHHSTTPPRPISKSSPARGSTSIRSTAKGSNNEDVDDSEVRGGTVRRPTHHSPKKTVDESFQERDEESGMIKLKALLTVFTAAEQLLSQYKCGECIDVLHKLPQNHFRSGHVYHSIGKAFLELTDYRACLVSMKEMLKIEPYRVLGTETMSTALWHLKLEKELCALGQQVVDLDRFSPETWCVVGNCFSLQRDHDAAIRFFERAVQIDPWFTYAHTLCGHEHSFNENLDKATACFRNALRIDIRHYNAWYGLGSIFYRQERLEIAEYHFRKAANINCNSSALQCYLSIVLHAQNQVDKTQEALDILRTACSADSKNPQMYFQLAHVLLSCAIEIAQFLEVETVLLTARDLAPREAPVYIMLGQVSQRLGKPVEALYYLNTALDLDPKQASSIKSMIDELGAEADMPDAMDLLDAL